MTSPPVRVAFDNVNFWAGPADEPLLQGDAGRRGVLHDRAHGRPGPVDLRRRDELTTRT